MKRTVLSALGVAVAATLLVAGSAAARGPDPGRGPRHDPDHHPATLRVKANAAHPGGTLRILALVKAPVRTRPTSVNAIVHFASGDIAVALTRHGHSKGAAYHGSVAVAPTEVAGEVMIDATAIVNGTTLNATGKGKIEPGTAPATSHAAGDEASESASSSSAGGAAPSVESSDDPSDSAESSDQHADSIREFVAALLSVIAALLS